MNRYISDLHFGHANILRYDNRPFKDVDDMWEYMRDAWNSTVKKTDTTYIVGDVVWQAGYQQWVEILQSLNGDKYIVRGNHDESATLKRLEKDGIIKGWQYQYIVKENGKHIVLNHSPMPWFVNMHKPDWYHLYGHVHLSFDLQTVLSVQRSIEELYLHPIKMYHVGCMMPYMAYAPKTLEEIEAGFAKFKETDIDFVKRKIGVANHE